MKATTLVHRLLEMDPDKGQLMNLLTPVYGYVLRVPAHSPANKTYPWLNRRWSNASSCCGNLRRYIGDATVYKRKPQGYNDLEVVPVYGDPRRYGERALNPSLVVESEDSKELLNQLLQPEDFQFVSKQGIPFLVHLAFPDEREEKRRDGFKPTEPTVTFYDQRYISDRWPRGQQVTSYYVTTLVANHSPGSGLDMVGHEPAWKLDGESKQKVVDWIKSSYPGIEYDLQRDADEWVALVQNLPRRNNP